MAKTITTTNSSKKTNSQTRAQTQSESLSSSQSTTSRFIDEALLKKILGGLTGRMTDGEIDAYAENLLRPQYNAQREAAQQAYETTRLSKEAEIELLKDALTASIAQQEAAYRRSMADTQTAALARGMGRSSYALESIASQGDALAQAVKNLTKSSEKEQSLIQKQITQAAQQSQQTLGRLSTDYAASLAAKVQELRNERNESANNQYLTAVSGSMGTRTEGSTQEKSTSTTNTSSTGSTRGSSVTVTKKVR